MDQLEIVLLVAATVYTVLVAFEVLSLKPRSLVRKTPVVVKSVSLILVFVNLILLLSFTLSEAVVPYVVANPGILSGLAILGMALLVGFGVASALNSKTLYHRIELFVHMTKGLQNPN
jgi:hypothetical protein